jgi:hypothetical protein
MTRRIVAGAVAVVLLTVGLLALRWPVYLPDFDPWGVQVKCGSGLARTWRRRHSPAQPIAASTRWQRGEYGRFPHQHWAG